MIVSYEFGFDTFQPDRDRIYRVVTNNNMNGMQGYHPTVPDALANAVSREVSGLEQVVPILQFPIGTVVDIQIEQEGSKALSFKRERASVLFTTTDYLHMQDYQWLAGKISSSLQEPYKVVLTKSSALRYFAKTPLQDIIGRKILYNGLSITVAGIVADIAHSTDFKGQEFISLPTIEAVDQAALNSWALWNSSSLYIKLAPHVHTENIHKQLQALFAKHKPATNTYSETPSLQLLADIHFDERYQGVDNRTAHKPTLYGLLAIALFLLLLGCINYINLTTAQATKRAKEVGIRKAIGSSKRLLMVQFLGETFLLATFATLLSVFFVPILLKIFALFIPNGLNIAFLWKPSMLLFILLLVILVSLLSGFYPAFVLSRYKPIQVLKSQSVLTFGQSRQTFIRKTLTVSQFVCAQFFVIATLMMSKQIHYMLHADMGFQKNAIFTFSLPRDTTNTFRVQLQQRLQSIPGIKMVSNGFFAPAMESTAVTMLRYSAGREEHKINAHIRFGDANFLNLYQIKLLAGRHVLPKDSITELIANESFARAIGFETPEKLLGNTVVYGDREVPIVGIMQDFHTQNFRATISPMVFGSGLDNTFHIQLQAHDPGGKVWQKAISQAASIYKENYPEEDFHYQFIDESITQFYQKEQVTAMLLRWATALAILISCLGLLGLAIHSSHMRIKEIGIRKVLGASIMQIVALLSSDFVRLIFIAFMIASPLAWWATYEWLKGFAYKTPFSWWIFLAGGIGILLIALLVISTQVVKTAMANPVDSLRDE